uniref:pLS20_p028 family conjugation system transmembrane protein n=1 Tax=Carnobacterium sp. TaxID=48221 RepID=UPI003450C60E
MKGKNSKKILIIGGILFGIFITALLFPNTVFASLFGKDIPDGTVAFLKNHSEWLQRASMLTAIGHMIGWGLTKGLFSLVTLIEGLIPKALDLTSFLKSAGINNLATAVINDLVVALMVLMIVIIGIKTIIAKEPPKFKNVAFNVITSGLLIMGMPTLMNTMQTMAIDFYNSSQSGESADVESLSWGLIKDNTADLIYLSKKGNGFKAIENGADEKGLQVKNNMTSDKFMSANVNSVLTSKAIDEADTSTLEPLKYELDIDENNEYTANKMEGNFLSFFKGGFETGYFRYPIRFAPIIIGLIALGVAYVFTIFIFISTIIEIGIKRVVGLFVFATDLESGQRTKMVVTDIMNAYMLIAFTGLSLRFYTIFLSYLSVQKPNIFIYVIAIVSATFILIKGSSTIMRYFGVDIGLKEGYGQLAGAFALGKTLSGAKNKLKTNKSKKTGRDSGEEGGTPSINDKVKDTASNIGKSAGYMKERGIKGMMKDSIKQPLENMGSGMNEYSDSLKSGYSEGTEKAKDNSLKYDKQQKTVSDNNEQDLGNNTVERKGSTADSISNNNSDSLEQTIKQKTVQDNENSGSLGDKEQVDREVRNNNATNSLGDKEQVDREVRNNNATNSLGDKEQVDREVRNNNATNSLGDKEQVDREVRNSNATNSLGDKEQVDREIRNNNATGSLGDKQQVDREVRNNNATNSLGDKEQVDREVRNNNATGSLGDKQQVDREVRNNNATVGSVANNPSTRQVNEEVRGTGSVANNPSTRQVNEEVRGTGSVANNPSTRQVNEEVRGTGSVANNPSTRQVNEEVRGTSSVANNPSTRQVNEEAIQKVVQQVQKADFTNSQSVTQHVVQAIQNSSLSSGDQKQRVIQEVLKGTTPSPEKITQNIQQIIDTTGTNVSPETKVAVQKVINDVQSGSNYNPETLKNKVIQEFEKSTATSNEPVKQKVIQDIQKAFVSSPQEVEQRIKQVMESETRNDTTHNIQANESNKVTSKQSNEVTSKQNNKETSYFSTLFTNDLLGTSNKAPVKNRKRFDGLKNL